MNNEIDEIIESIKSTNIEKLNKILIQNITLSDQTIIKLIDLAIQCNNIDILNKILEKIRSDLILPYHILNHYLDEIFEVENIEMLDNILEKLNNSFKNIPIEKAIDFIQYAINSSDIIVLNKFLEFYDIELTNFLNISNINVKRLIISAIESGNIHVLDKILNKTNSLNEYVADFKIRNFIIHAIKHFNVPILNKLVEFYNINLIDLNMSYLQVCAFINRAITFNELGMANKMITLIRINHDMTDIQINNFISLAIKSNNLNIFNLMFDMINITQNLNLSTRIISNLMNDAILINNTQILNYILEKFIKYNPKITNGKKKILIYMAIRSDNFNILNKTLYYLQAKPTNTNVIYFINGAIKSDTIEILDKIFEYFDVDITLDLLFNIIRYYKNILNKKLETSQSMKILNNILGKINYNIINEDFYIEFCDLIFLSSMYYVFGTNDNINSTFIYKIIHNFHYLNDEKFNEIKKNKPFVILNDINSHIASFLGSKYKY
jgi:hypothetical protein